MSEDFDLKLKRQEAGMIDKKTGKVSPPYDKGTQNINKLKGLSKALKVVGIPLAIGVAAYETYKKRKDKKESMKEESMKEDDVYVMPNTSKKAGFRMVPKGVVPNTSKKAEPDSKRGGGMIIARGNKLARSKPTKLY
jgi:hypothetical protein